LLTLPLHKRSCDASQPREVQRIRREIRRGSRFGVALVTESVRSLTMANVVYREIVDYKRVYDTVLAYRTGESAPAVRAFIETCKGLRP
jgi:hypothetical protein